MKRIFDGIFVLLEGACKIMMILQVLITTYVVTGRYIFNKTPAWGEQVTLMLLTWLGLMSSAITMRENAHIKVTIIERLVPAGVIRVIDYLVDVVLLAFFGGLFYSGWLLAGQSLTTILPALGVSKVWLYASVPTAAAFLIVATVMNLAGDRGARNEIEERENID